MSELKNLLILAEAIVRGENGKPYYERYRSEVERVTPEQVISLVDELMKKGYPVEQMQEGVNKFLNLFHKALDSHPVPQPESGSFLDFLMQSNQEMAQRLDRLKPLIRLINGKLPDQDPDLPETINNMREILEDLKTFERHYLIKENILFPAIEEHWPDYRCVQLMWAFHDDIRKNIREAIETLQEEKINLPSLNYLFGSIFFNMLAIRFREERILFPVMLKTMPDSLMSQLLEEAGEIGFAYSKRLDMNTVNDNPKNPKSHKEDDSDISQKETGTFQLPTGSFSEEEILVILNTLPVDLTFVDRNDKVKYFSQGPHRIFTRSRSIIGRDVRLCHPPASVDIVERILEDFKSGRTSHAPFWIQMNGRFIYIEYYALRNEQGEYLGTLEVSQDLTEYRKLEGEQRLLSYQEKQG